MTFDDTYTLHLGKCTTVILKWDSKCMSMCIPCSRLGQSQFSGISIKQTSSILCNISLYSNQTRPVLP